jgi:branched-chain amino acid transport system substrate-binding protein
MKHKVQCGWDASSFGMRPPRRLWRTGLVAIAGLVVAACGSGSTQSGTTSGCGQVTIGFLGWANPGGATSGTSGGTLDPGDNLAAKMAIDDINSAGGVCGKPVKYVYVPFDETDLQGEQSEFLEMVAKQPTIIVGMVSPDLATLEREVDAAGIPILVDNIEHVVDGVVGDSQWFFGWRPPETVGTVAQVEFAVQTLGAQKVALFQTSDEFGAQFHTVAAAELQQLGIPIVTNQSFPDTATDLTAAVLASKSASITINGGYPAQIAAELTQDQQYGIKMTVVDGLSAMTGIAYGLIPLPLVGNLYGAIPCTTWPPPAAWTTRFEQASGTTIKQFFYPETYDMVRFAAAAITQANTTDPTKILSAVETLKYTSGVCSSLYQSDAQHFMNANTSTVSFSPATGAATIVKTYTANS